MGIGGESGRSVRSTPRGTEPHTTPTYTYDPTSHKHHHLLDAIHFPTVGDGLSLAAALAAADCAAPMGGSSSSSSSVARSSSMGGRAGRPATPMRRPRRALPVLLLIAPAAPASPSMGLGWPGAAARDRGRAHIGRRRGRSIIRCARAPWFDTTRTRLLNQAPPRPKQSARLQAPNADSNGCHRAMRHYRVSLPVCDMGGGRVSLGERLNATTATVGWEGGLKAARTQGGRAAF